MNAIRHVHRMFSVRAEAPPVVPKKMPVDFYFSADVETDGPIPGPFSMLSFGMVYAGWFDGARFHRVDPAASSFYRELKPISDDYQEEALAVNGLDRSRLAVDGLDPREAMTQAHDWVRSLAGNATPVLVAYPLSFDWTWLYWYFVRFSANGSPFSHSSCYDMKTAFAVKAGLPIAAAGRSRLPSHLKPTVRHTHHALDDAIGQAEFFANVFEWRGFGGRNRDAGKIHRHNASGVKRYFRPRKAKTIG